MRSNLIQRLEESLVSVFNSIGPIEHISFIQFRSIQALATTLCPRKCLIADLQVEFKK